MSEYEKLEYIHCSIQESLKGNTDYHMLNQALKFVEDIREKHLIKKENRFGNTTTFANYEYAVPKYYEQQQIIWG